MTRYYIEKQREIPITIECDVLVVGGGTAGFVAALAAAETGANTILVEKGGFLGGAMIHGATALHSFFNLYRMFPDVPKKQLVRGIPEKIVQAMIAAGGCPGHVEMDLGYNYDSMATCFDPETFKKVAFDLIEAAGIRLLLHTFIVDTICNDSTVRGVVAETKSGREAILAKVIIDTTGDGDVAFHAGAEYIDKQGIDDYAVANTFGMGNVDLAKVRDFLEANGMLSQVAFGDKGGTADRIIRLGFNMSTNEKLSGVMRQLDAWGPLTVSTRENQLTYINCTKATPINGIDRDDMTRAEIALRRQISEMVAFLKENIPGFEQAYLNWTSPQICIRRTRTIICEYDISIEDITEARSFPDDVAHYGFHDLAPRYVVKDGGSYGIPYRALLPKKLDGLLVAGRMITSEYAAHMSTRNTVSCMAQGQAVGTAAALAAKKGLEPRALPIDLLQDTLKEQGVYLGRE